LLGDQIREEVVSGATCSLAFLQVVSKAMLGPDQDEEKNWCFKEYSAYKSGDRLDSTLARTRPRLFIFLIAERSVQGNPAEAVRPFADLRDAYRPWHDHMLQLKTTTLDRMSRVALKEQIESVARQVHEFRHSKSTLAREYAHRPAQAPWLLAWAARGPGWPGTCTGAAIWCRRRWPASRPAGESTGDRFQCCLRQLWIVGMIVLQPKHPGY